MQRLKSFTCSLLLCALCSILLSQRVAASESDTLSNIGKQIEQHEVVRADFVQTKHMAALKRPLITHGKLLYSRAHGILWQIEKPFRTTYVLGESKIVEISADGVRKERGLSDIPALAQIGRVFRAMLGANTEAVKNNFDASVQGDSSKWQIQLLPNQSQLKQYLVQLTLNGSHFVERIEIAETNGDTTRILLKNSQAASAPDAAELHLLTGSVKTL